MKHDDVRHAAQTSAQAIPDLLSFEEGAAPGYRPLHDRLLSAMPMVEFLGAMDAAAAGKQESRISDVVVKTFT